MMMFGMRTKLRETAKLMTGKPDAEAVINGSAEYPDVTGMAAFFQLKHGVLAAFEVSGLPKGTEGPCDGRIFALHIHEGGSCSGTPDEPFSGAGMHFNPDGCEHPHHAGDMPPLFSNDGYAYMIFFTDRFSVEQIIGRSVIIHSGMDDFTSQPSGNAGMRIACGLIR